MRMFEKQLTSFLNKYLGSVLEGIDPDDVRVGVLNGDVIIRKVKVKAEALTVMLDEPSLAARRGYVEELRVRVPWRRLGKEPVRVTFNGVYIVGEIDPTGASSREETREDRDRKVKAKAAKATRAAANAAEQAWLKCNPAIKVDTLEEDIAGNDASQKEAVAEKRKKGIAGIIDVVMANVIVEISKIHVRIEDTYGDSKIPCAMGFTLEGLSLSTVADTLAATFQVGGFDEKLRKLVKLEHMGAYADFGSESIIADVPNGWASISHDDFVRRMSSVFSMRAQTSLARSKALVAPESYIFGPIQGNAMYVRRGQNDIESKSPMHQLKVNMDAIRINIRSSQVKVFWALNTRIKLSRIRHEYVFLRPKVTVMDDRRAWWKFAIECVKMHVQQVRKRRGLDFELSIEKMIQINKARSSYIPLYLEHLRRAPPPPECMVLHKSAQRNKYWPPKIKIGDSSTLDKLEDGLPVQSIVLFRILAHKEYRESNGLRAAVVRERLRRYGNKFVVVGTLFKLAGGGMKNVLNVSKMIIKPVFGAVDKKDSAQLVRMHRQASRVDAHAMQEWNELAEAVDLQERNKTLLREETVRNNKRLSVSIPEIFVTMIDDEIVGEDEREIFRISISHVLLGKCMGGSISEQRLLIQNVIATAPEGKLIDLNGDAARILPSGDASRHILWGTESVDYAAVQLQMIKGDPETDEEIFVRAKVQKAFVNVLREPLDRVAATATRHQITKSYIKSYVFDDDMKEQSNTDALVQKSHSFKIKPRVKLDLNMHAPLIVLPASGDVVNLCIDLGSVTVKSVRPISVGVPKSAKDEHNANRIRVRGLSAGFIQGCWDIDTIRSKYDPVSFQLDANALPFLHTMSVDLSYVQNLDHASQHPNMALSIDVPKCAVDLSPIRVHNLNRVIKTLKHDDGGDKDTKTAEEAKTRDTPALDVAVLQHDELGEFKWKTATIAIDSKSFFIVDITDDHERQNIRMDLTGTAGASKLRKDICQDLGLNANVLVVGKVVLSQSALADAISSQHAVIIRFDAGESTQDAADSLAKSWYDKINTIARENSRVRFLSAEDESSSSTNDSVRSKVNFRLQIAFEQFALHMIAPLKPHPAEEHQAWDPKDDSHERPFVDFVLGKLTIQSERSRTCSELHVGANSLMLYDMYASQAYGKEIVTARPREVLEGVDFLTITSVVRSEHDPDYDGVTADVRIKLGDVIFDVGRSTLTGLISFCKFRLRPPTWRLHKVLPKLTPKVLVNNALVKKVSRRIDCEFTSVTAHMYYNQPSRDEIKAGTLCVERVLWTTAISSPTRQTDLSIGDVKVAASKMEEWSVKSSSKDVPNILLLKNVVYDTGEEVDGADTMLNIELGGLDVIWTPDLQASFTYLGSFMPPVQPDHMPKFIHPADKPRPGFIKKKSRLTLKMDSPTIILPGILESAPKTIILPGNLEITKRFYTGQVAGKTLTYQKMQFMLNHITVATKAHGHQESQMARKPLEISGSIVSRVDDAGGVINQIDDAFEVKIKPISLDVSGADVRCISDCINVIKNAEAKELISAVNPIIWGKVPPKEAEIVLTPRVRSKQYSASIGSVQLSMFKQQMRQRPISTAKLYKIQMFAVKDLNNRKTMEMDVILQRLIVEDNSSEDGRNIGNILQAGTAHSPLVRLKLDDDVKQTRLRLSLQPVHIDLRVGVYLDTLRTFTSGKLGGEVSAGSLLPKDFNCLNGRDTSLSGDVALTQCTRLLADDFKSHSGSYKLNGNGHTVYFVDNHDEVIVEDSEILILPETLPRIIIGYGSMLKFENIKFACSSSALARFIKMSHGASYSFGAAVEFVDVDRSALNTILPPVVKNRTTRPKGTDKPRDLKPLLVSVDASCLHFTINGEEECDQLNVMLGLAYQFERDSAFNTKMTGKVRRLRTTDTMTPSLLEPLSATVHIVNHGGVKHCTGSTTPIIVEVTPHRLAVLSHFSKTMAQALAVAPLLKCTTFACVWGGASDESNQAMVLIMKNQDNTAYTVWRPVVRDGYASLADVVKPGQGAPDTSVTIVRDSPALCALPLKFEKIDGSDAPCFWRPIAPPGFVSLGVVASTSVDDVPSLRCVRCIRQELVTNSGQASALATFPLYGELSGGATTMWQLGNQTQGCNIVDSRDPPNRLDIRLPPGFHETKTKRKTAKAIDDSMFQCITSVDFTKIWTGRNRNSSYIGFWKVDCPEGFVSTGDCIAAGELPPLNTRVFAADTEVFQHPNDYDLVHRSFNDVHQLSIWKPIPAEGFVAVGFVATTGSEKPSHHRIVCIRRDLVQEMSNRQIRVDDAKWDHREASDYDVYFWETNTITRNFVATRVSINTDKEESKSISFDSSVGYICEKVLNRKSLISLQAQISIPSVHVALAFERQLRNQVFMLLQLREVAIKCETQSKVLNIAVDTELSVSHRNYRLNYAIEPVVEPWNVSLLMKKVQNDGFLAGPTATYFSCASQETLKVLITHSLLNELINAIVMLRAPDDEKFYVARSVYSKSLQKEEVFNSTGRSIWVQAPHGAIEEVPSGQVIRSQLLDNQDEDDFTIGAVSSESKHVTREAMHHFDKVNPNTDDERLTVAHIIVDILAIEESANTRLYPKLTFSIWNDDLKSLEVAPLPIGKFHGAVSLLIPHPLARLPGHQEYLHNEAIDIRVEFTYIDANGESKSTSGTLSAPIYDQRNGWIGSKLGCWVDCNDGNGEAVQVKLRAHVVEGLAAHPIGHLSTKTPSLSREVKDRSNTFERSMPPLVVCRTNDLKETWCSEGSYKVKDSISVWTPCAPSKHELETRYNFFRDKAEGDYTLVPFGTVLVAGLTAPQSALMAVVTHNSTDTHPATAFPKDFELLWASDCSALSFWTPIAPEGYVAVGNAAIDGVKKPPLDSFVCIREDLTDNAVISPAPIWKSRRNFKSQSRTKVAVYRTGMQSTGGWTFIHQKARRDQSGIPLNEIPSARQLSQKRCHQSLDDESVREMTIGAASHTAESKKIIDDGDETLAISFSSAGPFEEVSLHRKATHVVQHKTHGMIYNNREGKLKGLITCINEASTHIEVSVNTANRGSTMMSMTGTLTDPFDEDGGDIDEVTVFESERYYPFRGWRSPKDLNTFNGRFSLRLDGSSCTKYFPDVKAPKGYAFVGPWILDLPSNERVNEHGWAYGAMFVTKWPPPRGSSSRKGRATRRRRWFRKIELVKVERVERIQLRNMRRDTLDNWHNALAADGELDLPAFCGADAYTLTLTTDLAKSSREFSAFESSASFHLNWLLDKRDRAWSYSSGQDNFILVKQSRHNETQEIGSNEPLGMNLRILAPLQIQASTHSTSRVILIADGEEKLCETMQPGDVKHVTSVDTSKSISMHVTVFSAHVTLSQSKASLLNITEAGQPDATQRTWLNLKGYSDLKSLYYISASRSRAIDDVDAVSDDPSQHALSIEYRAALLVTNATPLSIRTIAWPSNEGTPRLSSLDDYVTISPGQTQPGTYYIKKAKAANENTSYMLGVLLDSTQITFEIAASAEPRTIFVPNMSGDKIALRCSCNVWSADGIATSRLPTYKITIQPAIAAVNLTSYPLYIRSNNYPSGQLLTPGAKAVAFPVDYSTSAGNVDVEEALNKAIIQLAVAPKSVPNPSLSGIHWSSPIQNILQYSGSLWSIPQDVNPSIAEISAFRRLPSVNNDGDFVSLVKPLLVQFRVERLINGCFMIVLSGEPSANTTPVRIMNHMRECVLVRQMKRAVDALRTPSKLRGFKKSTRNPYVGVGRSYALQEYSSMAWAWSSPSAGSTAESNNTNDSFDGSAFQNEKWLEFSTSDGEMTCIRVSASDKHGSEIIHLGSMKTRHASGEIFGFWRGEILHIHIIEYSDAARLNFHSGDKPLMNTSIAKELHLALDFVGVSATIIDRSQPLFAELFHISIDKIMMRRGSNLCLGKSIYTHLTVGAVQVDYSMLNARYPVFIWHDASRGSFFECYFTLSWKDAGEVLINCYHQKTPEGGLYVRATEYLLWQLYSFNKSLDLHRLKPSTNFTSLQAKKNRKKENEAVKHLNKSRDVKLQILSLEIEPVYITLTFEPRPESRPADADAKLIGVLSFASVDRLSINIQRFTRRAQQIPLSDLKREFRTHLLAHIFTQTFHVLSSFDTLANVSSGLNALGKAVETGFGTLNSVSGSEGKAIVQSDIAYRDSKADNVAAGIFYGSEKLGRGITAGISGLVFKPVQGFRKRGMSGAAVGFAHGVTGLVTQPVAGAIGLVAKTVEGVASTAKDVKSGTRDIVMSNKVASVVVRRLPIAIRADGIVRAWDETNALGVYYLRTAVRMGKTFTIHAPGAKDHFIGMHPVLGDRKIIISAERVMYVDVSDKVEYLWQVRWSDITSVWIENAVFIYLQTNITFATESSGVTKNSENLSSRLRIHVGSESDAQALSANLRRVWYEYIDAR